jgi:hypothetical protein
MMRHDTRPWFKIIDTTNGQRVFAVQANTSVGAILRFRRLCPTEYHSPHVIALPYCKSDQEQR